MLIRINGSFSPIGTYDEARFSAFTMSLVSLPRPARGRYFSALATFAGAFAASASHTRRKPTSNTARYGS